MMKGIVTVSFLLVTVWTTSNANLDPKKIVPGGCKHPRQCQRKCWSYEYSHCYSGDCYCLVAQRLLPRPVVANCEASQCNTVQNLGKGLCTNTMKEPCEYFCSRALRADHSHCDVSNDNCLCFHSISRKNDSKPSLLENDSTSAASTTTTTTKADVTPLLPLGTILNKKYSPEMNATEKYLSETTAEGASETAAIEMSTETSVAPKLLSETNVTLVTVEERKEENSLQTLPAAVTPTLNVSTGTKSTAIFLPETIVTEDVSLQTDTKTEISSTTYMATEISEGTSATKYLAETDATTGESLNNTETTNLQTETNVTKDWAERDATAGRSLKNTETTTNLPTETNVTEDSTETKATTGIASKNSEITETTATRDSTERDRTTEIPSKYNETSETGTTERDSATEASTGDISTIETSPETVAVELLGSETNVTVTSTQRNPTEDVTETYEATPPTLDVSSGTKSTATFLPETIVTEDISLQTDAKTEISSPTYMAMEISEGTTATKYLAETDSTTGESLNNTETTNLPTETNVTQDFTVTKAMTGIASNNSDITETTATRDSTERDGTTEIPSKYNETTETGTTERDSATEASTEDITIETSPETVAVELLGSETNVTVTSTQRNPTENVTETFETESNLSKATAETEISTETTETRDKTKTDATKEILKNTETTEISSETTSTRNLPETDATTEISSQNTNANEIYGEPGTVPIEILSETNVTLISQPLSTTENVTETIANLTETYETESTLSETTATTDISKPATDTIEISTETSSVEVSKESVTTKPEAFQTEIWSQTTGTETSAQNTQTPIHHYPATPIHPHPVTPIHPHPVTSIHHHFGTHMWNLFTNLDAYTPIRPETYTQTETSTLADIATGAMEFLSETNATEKTVTEKSSEMDITNVTSETYISSELLSETENSRERNLTDVTTESSSITTVTAIPSETYEATEISSVTEIDARTANSSVVIAPLINDCYQFKAVNNVCNDSDNECLAVCTGFELSVCFEGTCLCIEGVYVLDPRKDCENDFCLKPNVCQRIGNSQCQAVCDSVLTKEENKYKYKYKRLHRQYYLNTKEENAYKCYCTLKASYVTTVTDETETTTNDFTSSVGTGTLNLLVNEAETTSDDFIYFVGTGVFNVLGESQFYCNPYKVVNNVCDDSDDECDAICEDYEHYICVERSCLCVEDLGLKEAELKCENDSCSNIYHVGSDLCDLTTDSLCRELCDKVFNTSIIDCDLIDGDEYDCDCIVPLDKSNQTVGVSTTTITTTGQTHHFRDHQHYRPATIVKPNICGDYGPKFCRTVCSSYENVFCLYENCYCMRAAESMEPSAPICREDACYHSYFLPGPLCNRTMRTPCERMCSMIPGSEMYECFLDDGSCNCIVPEKNMSRRKRSLLEEWKLTWTGDNDDVVTGFVNRSRHESMENSISLATKKRAKHDKYLRWIFSRPDGGIN